MNRKIKPTNKKEPKMSTKCTDNLTLGEIKELMSIFNKPLAQEKCLWQTGKLYFIRTVTMHLIGRLEAVTTQELLLSQASWIADSGRFHDAIKTGKLNEVEPFISDVIVGRSSIIDATEWKFDAPTTQK